jgi:hypothetical protein
MTPAETSIQISSEMMLTAACGHETLLLRCDWQGKRASVAIDENDNGTVVSISGNIDLIRGLCKALDRKPVEEPDEQRSIGFGQGEEGSATLIESAAGYELKLAVIGERERTACFSRSDGELLREAIRGTFSIWD